MSKYIKLEDAIDALYSGFVTKTYIENKLKDLPTIDIVRCKDCKHNPKRTNDFACGRCVCCCEDDWYGYVPDDDFFCGHGERKDNEQVLQGRRCNQ